MSYRFRPASAAISLVLLTSTVAGTRAEPSPVSSKAECPVLSGAENLIDQNKRFVIVGEVHGTVQIPDLFGDLVCAFVSRKPVAVALEFDRNATPALQTYLRSNGDRAAVERLLQSEIWDRSFADGRSSQAMLTLLDRLRRMRSLGLKIELFATQPDTANAMDQHYYELEMAAEWVKVASRSPDATVLILVGRNHGLLARDPGQVFDPAASRLRAEDTLSLGGEPAGGAAWNCQRDGCGPHPLPGGSRKGRFVGVMTGTATGINGTYSVGTTFSASPPAQDTRVEKHPS